MVRTITFILMMIVFFGTHFVCDKYLKEKILKLTLGKVLLISLVIELLLIFLAGNITFFFYVMIYGTVMVASFISVFYRNKQLVGRQQ